MAITTFVASQILTAAQMNAVQGNDYNQTVSTKTASYTLVAADKGTRIVMNVASANTVTVNTSLFSAGDTLVIQNIGAGVSTVTAGTATVSSAGPLAIPQNGSGLLYFTSAGVSIFYPSAVTTTASALTLISATTIGNAVSTVTISSAFSATYDNYYILISGGVASTNISTRITLGSTATGYYFSGFFMSYSSNTMNGNSASNAAFFANSSGSANNLSHSFMLEGPFLAKRTIYTGIGVQSDTAGVTDTYNGFLDNNTSYTAFTITPTGTMTGGTVRVYGFQNS